MMMEHFLRPPMRRTAPRQLQNLCSGVHSLAYHATRPIRREHPLATITRTFGLVEQVFQELENYHKAACERLGTDLEGPAGALRSFFLRDYGDHVKSYKILAEKVEERKQNYGGVA